MLFSNRARLDLLLAHPKDVILSAIMVIYLDNLRPTAQTSLLIGLVLAYQWFPEQVFLLWGLFFILPLFSAAAAVLAIILVKRWMSGISGIIFILSALFILSGLAGTIWLLVKLTQGELLDLALFNLPLLQPAGWWFLFFLLAGLILILIAGGLAYLWGKPCCYRKSRQLSVYKRIRGSGYWLFICTAPAVSCRDYHDERMALSAAQFFDEVSPDSLAHSFFGSVFTPGAALICHLSVITADRNFCDLGFLFWGVNSCSLPVRS